MGTVKTVGVKELKNRLSEYLRDVRRGTRVLVTDRSEVVAEVRDVHATSRPNESAASRAARQLPPFSRFAPSMSECHP